MLPEGFCHLPSGQCRMFPSSTLLSRTSLHTVWFMASTARTPFAGQLQHSADLPWVLSTSFTCQLKQDYFKQQQPKLQPPEPSYVGFFLLVKQAVLQQARSLISELTF